MTPLQPKDDVRLIKNVMIPASDSVTSRVSPTTAVNDLPHHQRRWVRMFPRVLL
jgi:hypothetical protein